MSLPHFILLALATGGLFRMAHAQSVQLTPDARIYYFAQSTAGVDPGLIRKLRSGDVSELKPLDQTEGLNLFIPLGDTLEREVTVEFNLPTEIVMIENAASSAVALGIYSSDLNPDARFAVTQQPNAVQVHAPYPIDMCALSLVRNRAMSVLGTCALAKVSVVRGGRVKVLVQGQLASVTPPR